MVDQVMRVSIVELVPVSASASLHILSFMCIYVNISTNS